MLCEPLGTRPWLRFPLAALCMVSAWNVFSRWLVRHEVSRRDNLDRHYILKLFGFGIFIHRIHHDEQEGIYHNHPWHWFSIILGRYIEELPGHPKRVCRFFNSNKATQHHRVELPHGQVWTILFHGRRCNQWSVINSANEVIATEPWRGIGGQTSYNPEGGAK